MISASRCVFKAFFSSFVPAARIRLAYVCRISTLMASICCRRKVSRVEGCRILMVRSSCFLTALRARILASLLVSLPDNWNSNPNDDGGNETAHGRRVPDAIGLWVCSLLLPDTISLHGDGYLVLSSQDAVRWLLKMNRRHSHANCTAVVLNP